MSCEEFKRRFLGAETCYGLWDHPTHGTVTRLGQASDTDWDNHLDGKQGLGIVPVSQDGTVMFSVIDIDEKLDHRQLIQAIHEKEFPLTVCSSKRGRAHCYLFLAKPLSASYVRRILKRWGMILGYPKAEVFPKQSALIDGKTGNWINLPYFGDERKAIKADGSTYSLTEFLSLPPWSGRLPEGEGLIEGAPPCLEQIMREGLSEPGRNQGLFNFAVYWKRADPVRWEDHIVRANSEILAHPLPLREIEALIRSHRKRSYTYTCEQEPICSRCNKEECLTRKWGIKAIKTDELDYDDLVLGQLIKLLTDPPRYLLEVNGRSIEMTADILFVYRMFKMRVIEHANIIIRDMKQAQWEQIMREKLSARKEVEAPEDASLPGQIVNHLHTFLSYRTLSEGREDLLKGHPVTEEDNILFRGTDFLEYLKDQKVGAIASTKIWSVLRERSCHHRRISVCSKTTVVWSMPLKLLNEQSGDFTAVDFKDDL